MSKKIHFLLSILILIASITFAQKGFVRGKIIDNKTGETLIGVTVQIVGTTTGTISDFDGNYSIGLKPGTYTIQVSYISYQTQTFPDIVVNADDVKIINVNLDEEVAELNEVIVTAKQIRNTEASLQVMQKKSASMIDGISSQQISKLGDDDAASALKRVTGVSVQDDKYVFVRGLGDRYTKITLNNADIPALDPEKNTVQMDIFPSNIIENIIVHKTFTPEIPGESTGGHVDIVTKDFPERFTMQFSASFGYNPQANLNKDFLTYNKGKTDWLAIEDGSRDVPAIAKDYLNEYGYISQVEPPYYTNVLNQITSAFNTDMAPYPDNSGINQSYKFSVGNQISLSDQKAIGYNIALNYSNGYKYYDNGVYTIYEEGDQPDPWKDLNKVISGSQTNILAGLVNLNFKVNSNNKVGVRFIRNQSGKNVALSRKGFFNYEDQPDVDMNLAYLQRDFNSLQLHGKHVFPNLNKMTAKWGLSYTDMNQDEPDLRFFEYLLPNDSTLRIKTNDAPARFYRDMNEKNYHANLDFELPVSILGDQSKIKFGGTYTQKDRNLDETKVEIQTSVAYYPLQTVKNFLENNIISDQNIKGYFYSASKDQDLTNSYEGHQDVAGGYAMIDMPLSEHLRVIGGARLEYTQINVNNKVADTTAETYKGNTKDYTDILPSLNIIYSFNDEMNLRLAGSRTIARPTFKEIGTNYYDYKTGIFVQGNQELERSLIWNADIRWEWFFAPGEKVSISGFYKYFTDPIEQKLSVTTQNYEIKFVNTDDASLIGAEIEFRKKLDFITAFRNLVFGGNFTVVNSVVKLTAIEQEDTGKEDRPMYGQAPWILNAYLGYNNRDKGLEANMGFNVTGEKLIIITKGSTPYIFEQPFPSLNFNISKGFGEDRNFTVELGVNNILDSEYQAVHHFEKPVAEDRDYLKYGYGRTFKVGFKYLID